MANEYNEYNEIMTMLKSVGFTADSFYDANLQATQYNVNLLSIEDIAKILDLLKKLSIRNNEIRDNIFTSLYVSEKHSWERNELKKENDELKEEKKLLQSMLFNLDTLNKKHGTNFKYAIEDNKVKLGMDNTEENEE